MSRFAGASGTSPPNERGDRRSLLVVDDDSAITLGLGTLFVRRGYAVFVAHSAARAIAILQERTIHGLVIDFHIAGTPGDVLFAVAAELQPHLASRTVFVSGEGSDTVPDALSATRCPIVRKPFEFAELERVVHDLLDGDHGRAQPKRRPVGS